MINQNIITSSQEVKMANNEVSIKKEKYERGRMQKRNYPFDFISQWRYRKQARPLSITHYYMAESLRGKKNRNERLSIK